MSLAVSKLVSSAVQIVLFSVIPFVWWLITARKKTGFFEWIGLKKPEDTKGKKTVLWIAATIGAFMLLSVYMLSSLKGVETATSDFAGKGIGALAGVLIYAMFNTALPEEILFRGFLLKRVSAKFGEMAGITVSSIAFGLMHGVMFFNSVGAVKAVIIIVFTGAIGFFMGYINEKKAGGSILPSWCIHSAANIFSALMSAFSVF